MKFILLLLCSLSSTFLFAADAEILDITGAPRSCNLNIDYSIDYTSSRQIVITVIGGTADYDPQDPFTNGCNPNVGGPVSMNGGGTSTLTYEHRDVCLNQRLNIIVNWNPSGARRLEVTARKNNNGPTDTEIFTFLGRQVEVVEPDYGILCLPDGNNHSINVGSIGPTGATSKTWSYTVSDGSSANFSSPNSQYTTFNGLHSKAFWSINSTWTCPGESPSVGGVSFYAGDPTDQECSYSNRGIEDQKDEEEVSIGILTEEGLDEIDLNEQFVRTRENPSIDVNSDEITSLFPNPVSLGQQITLKVNKNLLKRRGHVSIIISDINGKVVLNSRIQNIVTTLNLDHVVNKGYYIIQIVGDNEVNKIPFIIR